MGQSISTTRTLNICTFCYIFSLSISLSPSEQYLHTLVSVLAFMDFCKEDILQIGVIIKQSEESKPTYLQSYQKAHLLNKFWSSPTDSIVLMTHAAWRRQIALPRNHFSMYMLYYYFSTRKNMIFMERPWKEETGLSFVPACISVLIHFRSIALKAKSLWLSFWTHIQCSCISLSKMVFT